MSLNKLRAINRTRGKSLVADGWVADTWWTRLKGLLGHAPLKTGEGLLLHGEKAIHTVGMSFPIDVLFLDASGKIVYLIPTMGALKFSPFVHQASDVLELPAGILAQTGTALGDQIDLSFS